MPHDEESDAEPQCEACGETIKGEIYANEKLDAVCLECYSEQCECYSCKCSVPETDAVFWRSNPFCEDCSNDHLTECDSCAEAIYKRKQAYYYWDQSGDTYCEGCAQDHEAYCCDNCGNMVAVSEYIDNEGEDYIYGGELCYSCWETRGNTVHLNDSTSWGILKKCVFDDAYMELVDNDNAQRWVSDFYGYRLDEYEHQALLLQKGGLKKNEFGFWEGHITVDSEINIKINRWVERIIGDGSIKTSHKKLGEIRPFGELLQYYCRFEYRQESDYDTTIGEYVYNVPDLYVNVEKSRELRADIAENKLKTLKIHKGGTIIKEINFKKAFNKLIKRYETLMIASWDGDTIYKWQSDWNKYLTNSVKIKLPVKIGFDPSIMAPLENFNGGVQACQNRRYVDTLAHSFADLLVNPHLLLLIYDATGNEIIGRSVIRTYFSGIDEDGDGGDVPFIAPSRLYLGQHTNVKNDICARMYDVLEQWAEEYYGEHKLIVYETSRHDQRFSAYIENDKHLKIGERNPYGVLITDYWYPFFLEKPSDDAFFLYYPDEQQSRSSYRMEEGETRQKGYGVAEKMSSYRIISRRGDL